MRAPSCESALESFLIGRRRSSRPAQCAVVKATSLLPLNFRRLAQTAAEVEAGDVVVYAIGIEGSVVVRLLMLLTLGLRVARAQKVLHAAGAVRVRRYAMLPTLERPTIAYEIGTPAADYADRHLRPRGTGKRLRAIIARIAGVDPSIGAVIVAGVK